MAERKKIFTIHSGQNGIIYKQYIPHDKLVLLHVVLK